MEECEFVVCYGQDRVYSLYREYYDKEMALQFLLWYSYSNILLEGCYYIYYTLLLKTSWAHGHLLFSLRADKRRPFLWRCPHIKGCPIQLLFKHNSNEGIRALEVSHHVEKPLNNRFSKNFCPMATVFPSWMRRMVNFEEVVCVCTRTHTYHKSDKHTSISAKCFGFCLLQWLELKKLKKESPIRSA